MRRLSIALALLTVCQFGISDVAAQNRGRRPTASTAAASTPETLPAPSESAAASGQPLNPTGPVGWQWRPVTPATDAGATQGVVVTPADVVLSPLWVRIRPLVGDKLVVDGVDQLTDENLKKLIAAGGSFQLNPASSPSAGGPVEGSVDPETAAPPARRPGMTSPNARPVPMRPALPTAPMPAAEPAPEKPADAAKPATEAAETDATPNRSAPRSESRGKTKTVKKAPSPPTE